MKLSRNIIYCTIKCKSILGWVRRYPCLECLLAYKADFNPIDNKSALMLFLATCFTPLLRQN